MWRADNLLGGAEDTYTPERISVGPIWWYIIGWGKNIKGASLAYLGALGSGERNIISCRQEKSSTQCFRSNGQITRHQLHSPGDSWVYQLLYAPGQSAPRKVYLMGSVGTRAMQRRGQTLATLRMRRFGILGMFQNFFSSRPALQEWRWLRAWWTLCHLYDRDHTRNPHIKTLKITHIAYPNPFSWKKWCVLWKMFQCNHALLYTQDWFCYIQKLFSKLFSYIRCLKSDSRSLDQHKLLDCSELDFLLVSHMWLLYQLWYLKRPHGKREH